jgi:hypothetical protein
MYRDLIKKKIVNIDTDIMININNKLDKIIKNAQIELV